MLVRLSWQHLRTAWRSALAGKPAECAVGMSYRSAFLGFFGGFAVVWAFATAAGMAWWVSLAYIAVVLSVALVYGRLRGQTGVPLVWLFPFGMQKAAFLYTFGSQPFVAGSPTTMPVWGLFTFLARGYYPTVVGYQLESMELARRARMDGRRVVLALLLAVALGFIIGWINHLIPYYQNGALSRVDGIWGSWVARTEYQQAAQYLKTPKRPELDRLSATFVGGCIVVVLSFLHLRFTGFPLHPLGYAMACSYGSLLWGSFFLVWLLKSLALRYGGMRFYRQSIPFFLGFALGHLAVAGILWGLLGAWTGDAVRGYPVFFG